MENLNKTFSEENNSGQGKGTPAPDIVAKKFNWGAFGLTFIWGLFNKTYITLLVIPTIFLGAWGLLIQFVLGIWFGIKGNTWAWQNKKWNSVEHFQSVQKKWAAGLLIVVIAGMFWGMFSPALIKKTSAQMSKATTKVAIDQILESLALQEALEEKCELSSNGLAKCFEKRMNVRSVNNNQIVSSAGSIIWEFTANGVCKNKGDCSVKISIGEGDAKMETILPIYLKNNGYLEVKAEDIEDAKRKHGITN